MISRDNNFDFIRLLAALQVVAFHASIHLQAPLWAPLAKLLALFPGVPVFFFLSGLLVTASLESRPLGSYAWARAKRIFPALWLCFALTIVILGVFGQLEPDWRLIPWSIGQVTVVQVWHPEMFRDFGVGVVNGSLWTIPVEVGFYCLLPFIPRRTWLWAILAVLSFGLHQLVDQNPATWAKLLNVTPLAHLWLFAGGVLTFIHRERLFPLFRRFWWLPVAAYVPLGMLGLPEAVAALLLMASALGLGLAPAIPLKWDISYGVYLFHMLAVNSLVELGWFGPLAAWTAAGLAVLTGALSWACVESRVLKRPLAW